VFKRVHKLLYAFVFFKEVQGAQQGAVAELFAEYVCVELNVFS
jgi:hypothetical protein